MYERVYGAKYNGDLDTAAIAKLIRADIKAGVAAGELPGASYSVRTRRFSGGSAIDVRIAHVPFTIRNEERVRMELADPSAPPLPVCHYPIHSAPAAALLAAVESIVGAYNHDGSETQFDHFDVNFYGHVDFARETEKEVA